MARMSAEHRAEHEAIETDPDWEGALDAKRLWVHLSAHHGWRVGDVSNRGLRLLLNVHDQLHGIEASPEEIYAGGSPRSLLPQTWRRMEENIEQKRQAESRRSRRR